jgi:hypothetical protein
VNTLSKQKQKSDWQHFITAMTDLNVTYHPQSLCAGQSIHPLIAEVHSNELPLRRLYRDAIIVRQHQEIGEGEGLACCAQMLKAAHDAALGQQKVGDNDPTHAHRRGKRKSPCFFTVG